MARHAHQGSFRGRGGREVNELPEVILLRETALASVVKDMGVVAMFVLLIGIGILLDSTALQWVGALIGFSTIVSFAVRLSKDNRFTIEEARRRLDEIEADRS
jgi:Zn-dependent membrane protease YugP